MTRDIVVIKEIDAVVNNLHQRHTVGTHKYMMCLLTG